MRTRWLAVLVVPAGVLGASAAFSAGGGADNLERFARIDVAGRTAQLTPALTDPTRTTTVVVELAGAPVAVAQAAARAAGGELDRAERAGVRAGLRQSQDALVDDIARAGGTVEAQYQDALNGVKVRVSSRDLPKLGAIPGVSAVRTVQRFKPSNAQGVPYIGGNQTWQDLGLTGKGVKVAVLDTGIDYYHANLGGSGDPAHFAADNGLSRADGNFPTAKVVEGWDFVGDDYGRRVGRSGPQRAAARSRSARL